MNFADYLFEQTKTLEGTALGGYDTPSISYAQLWHDVQRLAAALPASLGERYLLLGNNSTFFVTCYLATLYSGNVVVPLEPRIGADDLADVARSCGPRAIFVDQHLRDRCAVLPPSTEVFTALDLPAGDPSTVAPIVNDETLGGVIIFTSGTLGKRKGVMLSHGNLRSNTASIIEYLELTSDDRMLVTLPFSYCYGASLLHTHLRVGGSLVFSNSISLGAVIKEIDRYACTGFAGVPATFQILINKFGFLDHTFPSLRYLTQAGGKLPDEYIEQLANDFPHKAFFVMYGATEATARLSYLPPALVREKLGSIGKGIPGVTLAVLDGKGQPVAPGETGEITAVGPNIMLGYYKDLEATRETLRDGRLFTGDLATVDEDGYIFVRGRAKQFIKSAGHRISPVEIEATIFGVPGVEDCRVIGVPDDVMGEAVVAVVQPRQNAAGIRADVLARCRQSLPSFKQPRRVECVKTLPLNASMKVNLADLKERFGGTG